MIRALGVAALLALVVAALGYAVVSSLLAWRDERRRRGLVLGAQREADLREQARRRDTRAWAKDAIAEASGDGMRAHPLGWTVVGLGGGRLAAISPAGDVSGGIGIPAYRVDEWSRAANGWLRCTRGDRVWREAVQALGGA